MKGDTEYNFIKEHKLNYIDAYISMALKTESGENKVPRNTITTLVHKIAITKVCMFSD
jgi:hypothetical protein